MLGQVWLEDTGLHHVPHCRSLSLNGLKQVYSHQLHLKRHDLGSSFYLYQIGFVSILETASCSLTSISKPEFLLPSWCTAYSLEISSLPLTPEFSARARGSTSNASAYFLMAYCSRPGQDFRGHVYIIYTLQVLPTAK